MAGQGVPELSSLVAERLLASWSQETSDGLERHLEIEAARSEGDDAVSHEEADALL